MVLEFLISSGEVFKDVSRFELYTCSSLMVCVFIFMICFQCCLCDICFRFICIDRSTNSHLKLIFFLHYNFMFQLRFLIQIQNFSYFKLFAQVLNLQLFIMCTLEVNPKTLLEHLHCCCVDGLNWKEQRV